MVNLERLDKRYSSRESLGKREQFQGNRNWEGKLLLVFWEGLGDAIVSIPAIRLVRHYYQKANLGVVAWNESQEEIFNTLGLEIAIERLSSEILGKGLRKDKKNLLKLPINLIEVFKNITDYDVVASVVSGKSFEFLRIVIGIVDSFGMAERFPIFLPSPHVTQLSGKEKYIADSLQEQIRKMLGIEIDLSFSPALEIGEHYKTFARNFYESSFPKDSRVVVLNFLTGDKNKNFPLEKFLELGGKLISNFDVYNLGVNFNARQEIFMKEQLKERILFFKSKSIMEVGAIIERADLYIGGDTGLSHFAYAVRTPSLVFFGPTISSTWLPEDRQRFPVREVEIPVCCRDYNCRTRFRCKKKEPVCLRDIPVERFMELAAKFLKN